MCKNFFEARLIKFSAILITCFSNLFAQDLHLDLSAAERSALREYTADHFSIREYEPTVVAFNQFELNNRIRKLLLWDASSSDIYSDRQHKFGLFVLNENSLNSRENAGVELTDLPLEFSEIENHFSQLRGNINLIKIVDDTLLFHVNIYSTLSGSGVISSATDLVISIRAPKFEPLVLFHLGRTGFFFKMGISTRTYENTRIRFGSRREDHDSLLLESGNQAHSAVKCIVLKATPGIDECDIKNIKSTSDTFFIRAFESFLASANATIF